MNREKFVDVIIQFAKNIDVDLHHIRECESVELSIDEIGNYRIERYDGGVVASLVCIYEFISVNALTKLLQSSFPRPGGHEQVHSALIDESHYELIVRVPECDVTLQCLFDIFDLLCGAHYTLEKEFEK